MTPKLNAGDLVSRSKEGKVSTRELREVAEVLESGLGGGDTYRLLYVLGRSSAYEYEALVVTFLGYQEDPMVARLALQVLCNFWSLAGRYREYIVRFLEGVEWDYFGDVRQMAISAAGEFLAGNQDCAMLGQLLRIGDSFNEDELERRFAVEAMARAVGLTYRQALGPDKEGFADWADWAEEIRSRGKERFAAECA